MIGRTLLHYTILERLGEGGMGEVYLAEDAKLNRRVALKVLPAEMALRPDRLARFQREAESVAALSHPNIVTIFSVEDADDVHFLTMELVDGQTLADVIPRDGMALKQILRLAVPIADALAAAHEAGVVHRDLKPSNIMVDRRGHLRILDFGLAKLQAVELESSDVPTAALTQEGTPLGTIPYMSPEQVQGRSADRRADIFALGILLYEMATGRRPFVGDSGAEIMSAILRDRPTPLAELRPDLPRQLGRIVEHCLQKEPDKRFQTALDLRNELESLEDEVSATRPEAIRTTAHARKAPRWVAALVLAAVALGLGWMLSGRSPRASEESVAPGSAVVERRVRQLTFGAELEEWPAFSPDGRKLVYTAEVDGFKKLHLRDLETDTVERLTDGFGDDVQPAWSPDGASLAFVRSTEESGKLETDDLFGNFFRGGDVWRIDLSSRELERLIGDAYHPTWSPDGERLAVSAAWAGAMRVWTTDARGRNPRQLTSDSSEAVDHYEPSWSPDGSRIAFRRREKSKSDVQIVEVATGESHLVTDDDYRDMNPQWAPDGGSIIFSSYRGGGQNLWRLPIDGDGHPTGAASQLTTGAGNDVQPAVSPLGDRVSFAVLGINSDLWRLPVDPDTGVAVGEAQRLVSTTREDSRGAWSPDGSTLAFNSDRLGEMNLWLKSMQDGVEKQLTRGSGGDFQPNWSPDGTSIAFFSSRAGNVDIWRVEVSSGELTQLTDAPSVDEDPFFSPDGSRIAFQSDRDGRLEVWVMNADGSEQRELSSIGTSGHFMRWTDDGSAIYFRSDGSDDSNFWRIPVDGGTPEALRELTDSGWHMSLSPDRSLVLDVTGHHTLWIYPFDGGERRRVFEFEDPSSRIDYPVWSPDGRWIVFDRADYQGADVWMLEGLD